MLATITITLHMATGRRKGHIRGATNVDRDPLAKTTARSRMVFRSQIIHIAPERLLHGRLRPERPRELLAHRLA